MSLERSYTIDVSGIQQGCWGPLAHEQLPHSHSASLVSAQAEVLTTEPSQPPLSACASPFSSAAGLVRNALGLEPLEPKQHEEGKHEACSEPVSCQRDENVFSASCSFPPYYPTLGSCISTANLSYQEASILLPGCPPHGVKAVCGKRAKMEDAFIVLPNFFDVPGSSSEAENKLPARIATQLSLTEVPSHLPLADHIIAYETDTLHFFGVYDGHGGVEAAQHCAKRLHHHLSELLAQTCQLAERITGLEPDASVAGARASQCNGRCHATDATAALPGSPDDVAASASELSPASDSSILPNGSHPTRDSSQTSNEVATTSEPSNSLGPPCPSQKSVDTVSALLQSALCGAFLRTDAEFASDGCAAMVGSTAVVALIGKHKIWIANCGDSRAVLCRAGKVIQLTDDHKPEREDEAARVEKAGGQVLYWNGHRVMGVLAMSRAIGDHGLRPYVIPEPEITVLTRCDDDDFLLLASDGLWDVMANQEATNLAIRCMHRAWEKGASRKAAVRIAASVLTKAAIDRGSKDNVTVVIVDLKTEAPPTAKETGTAGDSKDKEAAVPPRDAADSPAVAVDSIKPGNSPFIISNPLTPPIAEVMLDAVKSGDSDPTDSTTLPMQHHATLQYSPPAPQLLEHTSGTGAIHILDSMSPFGQPTAEASRSDAA